MALLGAGLLGGALLGKKKKAQTDAPPAQAPAPSIADATPAPPPTANAAQSAAVKAAGVAAQKTRRKAMGANKTILPASNASSAGAVSQPKTLIGA